MGLADEGTILERIMMLEERMAAIEADVRDRERIRRNMWMKLRQGFRAIAKYIGWQYKLDRFEDNDE